MQSPDYYQFLSQAKVISGNHAMAQIPIDLDGYGASRPLVLAGSDVEEKYLKKFQKSLSESNTVIGALFDEIYSNPDFSLIERLAALYKWKECDSIFVIGGGAVMDAAKILSAVVSFGSGLMTFAGVDNVPGNTVPLFYIPTAGQKGFETSNIAVIENTLFKSDYLFPDEICIDPSMVRYGDAVTIVENSFSALSNTIEAVAAPVCDPMSDAYAYTTIQFIYENLFTLQNKTCKKKPALSVANAIAFSGIVFSNSPEGIVHALAKELSVTTNYNEGLLKAVILPYALKIKLSSKEGVRGELLLAIAGIDYYSKTAEKERAKKGIELIAQFTEQFKEYIPVSLKDLNIPKYKIEEVVENVCGKSKSFDKKVCEKILESAWKGAV